MLAYDGDDDVDPAVVEEPVGGGVLGWRHARVFAGGLGGGLGGGQVAAVVARRGLLGEAGAVGGGVEAFWLGEYAGTGGGLFAAAAAGEAEEDAARVGGGGGPGWGRGRDGDCAAPDQAGLREQEARDGACCRRHGCVLIWQRNPGTGDGAAIGCGGRLLSSTLVSLILTASMLNGRKNRVGRSSSGACLVGCCCSAALLLWLACAWPCFSVDTVPGELSARAFPKSPVLPD